MIPKELAKKIRYIQIYTSKAVNDSLAGEYGSVFKGRGMEFDEVRQYRIGDDIRSIDWNVTARTGEPHVKLFVEERELTVVFLVDLSASDWLALCVKSAVFALGYLGILLTLEGKSLYNDGKQIYQLILHPPKKHQDSQQPGVINTDPDPKG